MAIPVLAIRGRPSLGRLTPCEQAVDVDGLPPPDGRTVRVLRIGVDPGAASGLCLSQDVLVQRRRPSGGLPGMADLYYMGEKFGNAVHHLAVTDAPLRERVRDAYMYHAHHGSPDMGGGHPGYEPSPQLADRVRALQARATANGPYDATFEAMTPDELRAVAEEIYEISEEIRNEEEDRRHSL